MMKKIMPIGYFRELAHGLSTGPSLKELARQGNYAEHKNEIISYLNSGKIYIASPGCSNDILGKSEKISGPIHALTDGKWVWPADLAYYVQNYDVALPKEFLADLKSRNWKQPPHEEINLLELEIEPGIEIS